MPGALSEILNGGQNIAEGSLEAKRGVLQLVTPDDVKGMNLADTQKLITIIKSMNPADVNAHEYKLIDRASLRRLDLTDGTL